MNRPILPRRPARAPLVLLERLEHRQLLAATFPVRINFQPGPAALPPLCRADTGTVFAPRANGYTYGWNALNNANARDRDSSLSPDQFHDTLLHMQKGGVFTWEMAVPNGAYTVRVVAGDADYWDSVFKINVENKLTVSGTPTKKQRWVEGTSTVFVNDARLTISNAPGAVNNKIAFIEVTPGDQPMPLVSVSAPDAHSSESGDPATFRMSRTGDLTQPLVVTYTVSGTATGGSDYGKLAGSVTIPAGKTFADVVVIPMDDTITEGSESITLTLTGGWVYSLGSGSSATITIADNETSSAELGQLSWSTRALLPVARVEGMSTVVDGKLYVFGGYLDSTWAPTARIDRYDPATNSWTRLKDMPERISHCGTATDGRYVYMAGGYPGLDGRRQGFATTVTRRYDPVTETWTNLKPLPQARGGGEMLFLNGTLYYIAGSDAKRQDHNDVWALNLNDPNAGWVAKTPLPKNRNHFGAVVLNGKLFVVGGQTGQEDWVSFKNDVWSYSPESNKWTAHASLPGVQRSHQTTATFVHQGKILTLGGETYSSVAGKPTALREVLAYDPAKNKWSKLTNLPSPRSTGFAASINGKIYFTGGYNGSVFNKTTWVGTFK